MYFIILIYLIQINTMYIYIYIISLVVFVWNLQKYISSYTESKTSKIKTIRKMVEKFKFWNIYFWEKVALYSSGWKKR